MKEHLNRTIADYYNSTLERFGDGPKAVNWSSEESQRLRFDILSQVGDLRNRCVHDVGCGLAHFYTYLQSRQLNCDYIGSDISEQMIRAAREKNPEGPTLKTANLLQTDEPWMRADYVLNSGVFTVKCDIAEPEWEEFVFSMIERMFSLCEVGIGFNLMTSYVDYKDGHLYYKSPDDILSFCVNNLSRRVVIRHDYPLWEYFTFIYKE